MRSPSAPSRSLSRDRTAASSSDSSSGGAKYEPSVSVVPMIIGTSADTSGASGSNGSRGSEWPSTTGPNRTPPPPATPPPIAASSFAIGTCCSSATCVGFRPSCAAIRSVVFCASLARHLLQRRSAFDDRLVEEAFRRRHRQQRADFAAAARLAEDRHVARDRRRTARCCRAPIAATATMSSMPTLRRIREARRRRRAEIQMPDDARGDG